MPRAPTPVSAVLSGLLLNVAMYAVVRCKILAVGAMHSGLPGRMLMGFGLLSTLLAALFLWRQRDIKRLFGYSSIEHMGIITFAFGMGGPLANFAALLHMTVHSLTKSAIFFAAGHASQIAGTQRIDGIRGLLVVSPHRGVGSDARVAGDSRDAALWRVHQRIPHTDHSDARSPLGVANLVAALGVAFAAIFSKVQPMVFGETDAPALPHSPALVPVFVICRLC